MGEPLVEKQIHRCRGQKTVDLVRFHFWIPNDIFTKFNCFSFFMCSPSCWVKIIIVISLMSQLKMTKIQYALLQKTETCSIFNRWLGCDFRSINFKIKIPIIAWQLITACHCQLLSFNISTFFLWLKFKIKFYDSDLLSIYFSMLNDLLKLLCTP